MSAQGVRVAKGYVEIGTNLDPLAAGLRAAQARLRSAGESIRSAGLGMFSFGVAGLTALAPSIMAASSAAEGFSKFQLMMGDQAGKVNEEIVELATSLGRVKSELRDTASSFQGMFVGLGMGREQAAEMSMLMVNLGLDFASAHDLSDSEASERFLAGLSGSSEVFDKFGINIKEAALKSQLAQMGISGAATELQKVQARVEIIRRTMADQSIVGNAMDTSGEFAGQLKKIRAQIIEASQSIGKTLIPVLLSYTPRVQELLGAGAKWLEQNPKIILGFAALAAGVTAGGFALLAVGQALTTASQLIGVSSSAVKILTGNWQAFAAAGAVALIAALAYQIYQASDALQDFNRETAKGVRLADELATAHQKAMAPQYNLAGKSLTEAQSAMELADRNSQGARNRAAGAHKRVAELSGWVNSLTGNKLLAEARQEAAEMDKLADASSKQATEIRKQVESMKSARKSELDTEYDAVQKRQQIAQQEAATAREAAASRKATIQAQAEDEFKINDPNRRRNPLAIARQQQQQGFQKIGEKIIGTFSGAALAGLNGRGEIARKQEQYAEQTASNTAQLVSKMDSLAQGLTYGS